MRAFLTVAILACVVSPLTAQLYFAEIFEGYPAGQLASGAGGWIGWDNVPTVMGDIVVGPAFSGTKSLEIGDPDDTIQPFVLNDPTGHPQTGFWRLTAMMYIPGASFIGGTGGQYILIQNQYNHLGPYLWALQLKANPVTGNVEDDDRVEVNVVPVVTDTWIQVRLDMDLDNDALATYYNNTLVSFGTFTRAANDPTTIACLDLWSNIGSTTLAYWDDIFLTQTTPEYQVNQAASSLDFNGLTNHYLQPIKATLYSTVLATVNFGCTGGASWAIALTSGLSSVGLSNGGFATVGGQVVNVNLLDPTLTFVVLPFGCATSSQVALFAPGQFTAQMVIVDSSLPEGFALSAVNEVDVLP